MSNIFDVVIEITKNSLLKYEVNKENGKLYLDRVLHGSHAYPHSYGYIEGTCDHDGDPLDVMVVSNFKLPSGTVAPVRILGSLEMIDGGDRDTKLIGVVDVDPRYNSFQKLANLPISWKEEIKNFFENYKKLENKEVQVGQFVEWDQTKKIIEEGIELFKKNKN